MCMYYPRRSELAWRFHVLIGSFQLSSVPQRQLSASARHSAFFFLSFKIFQHTSHNVGIFAKRFCCFWDSKLTAWIRLQHTALAVLHHRAPTRRQMRARENTVRSPDDCPFQVSSLWRSRGWVQEEFNPRDPRRLLLVRPETDICRGLQIPSRPRR